MSCLSDQTYSIYIDGELSPSEVREVESHLVQCQRCRALILALEDEASLLTDILQQRAPAVHRPVEPRARARGLAVGLAPSLGLGMLVLTVGGWVLERRLPGFSWIDPSSFIGAYEMAFDMIFTVRDMLPVLFDLGVAVGATVAMAAVLTFLVGAVLRRMVASTRLTSAVLVLFAIPSFAILLPADPSAAFVVRSDERTIEVAEGETLEETLAASGENVHINGVLRGDLVALAERVTIRGRVEGNVLAVAREVLVTGEIEGSLYMLCERCSLEGNVTGSLYAGAEDLTVTKGARIGRDAQLFGAGMRVDGSTGRDLSAAGEWIELRGEVARGVRTHSQRITVFDEARIGGDLVIEIPEDGEADVSDAAIVGGEVSQSVVEHDMHERKNRWMDGGFYMRTFVYIVSAFLVGLLLNAVLPSLFWGTLETSGEFVRCLGYGFVALVAVPILLVLCAVTVVGIPIAILGAFTYLTLLFVSMIVVAALVGTSLTGASSDSSYGFGVALLLGLVLVMIAMNLPFIGGLLRLLVGLAGMGLVITTVRDAWQSRRAPNGYA